MKAYISKTKPPGLYVPIIKNDRLIELYPNPPLSETSSWPPMSHAFVDVLYCDWLNIGKYSYWLLVNGWGIYTAAAGQRDHFSPSPTQTVWSPPVVVISSDDEVDSKASHAVDTNPMVVISSDDDDEDELHPPAVANPLWNGWSDLDLRRYYFYTKCMSYLCPNCPRHCIDWSDFMQQHRGCAAFTNMTKARVCEYSQ